MDSHKCKHQNTVLIGCIVTIIIRTIPYNNQMCPGKSSCKCGSGCKCGHSSNFVLPIVANPYLYSGVGAFITGPYNPGLSTGYSFRESYNPYLQSTIQTSYRDLYDPFLYSTPSPCACKKDPCDPCARYRRSGWPYR